MADEEKEEQEELEEPKKKSPIKLIIIIVAALAVLGGGGFAAYTMFLGGGHGDSESAEGEGHGEGHGEEAEEAHAQEIGPTHELESFIVNLNDVETNRYLKLTMHLELGSEQVAEHMEKYKPQIRDTVITLLSSKGHSAISDTKGKLKLKKEVILRLNDILGDGAVNQVFFTDFIVQ